MDHKVIRDSREKSGQGWFFKNTVEKKLDTGDYTLEGFENILTIDRKATTGELAHNITEKRFEREIERLRQFKYAFIVCEFDYAEVECFPHGSGIPQKIWPQLRIKPSFLKKKIAEYQIAGINIVFAGRFGQEAAMAIFREVLRDRP